MSGAERRTPLYSLHQAHAARMVPFAGYSMPVQYQGIVAEHLHTRKAASLFDVSHMGQVLVCGDKAAGALEKLLPLDLDALPVNHSRYTFFTTASGGLLDDLIITRRSDGEFMLVLNASRVEVGLAHLRQHLAAGQVEHFPGQALLALQGPRACTVLAGLLPGVTQELSSLAFMQGLGVSFTLGEGGEQNSGERSETIDAYISRSGYTGEDGFEISLPAGQCEGFAAALLEHEDAALAGLGARDSLRLEAGLCLYGHDLDETTSPVEAGLAWSIDKARRRGGSKAGGFIGADVILRQIEQGPPRKRLGFVAEGRAPVREGAVLVDDAGSEVGIVSSGGFSPSLERPIAMGYVRASAVDTVAAAIVRGKARALQRCKMPFVEHQYQRQT